jgi:hypothetical protein
VAFAVEEEEEKEEEEEEEVTAFSKARVDFVR